MKQFLKINTQKNMKEGRLEYEESKKVFKEIHKEMEENKKNQVDASDKKIEEMFRKTTLAEIPENEEKKDYTAIHHPDGVIEFIYHNKKEKGGEK